MIFVSMSEEKEEEEEGADGIVGGWIIFLCPIFISKYYECVQHRLETRPQTTTVATQAQYIDSA